MKRQKESKHLGITHKCDQCEYQSKFTVNLKQHINSKHLGITHKCDQCDSVRKSLTGLKSHKEYKHLGIIHKCDQCDSVRKTLIGLKNHKESKHLGIIHKCDQCDKVVTRLESLEKHKERKHRRYNCPECGHQGHKRMLQNHMKKKHLDITHKCDQCVWLSSSISELKIHKENEHRLEKYSPLKCSLELDYKSNYEDPTVPNQQEIIDEEINLTKDTPSSEDYACPACFFKTNDKKGLQIHTDAKHDGITYGKY